MKIIDTVELLEKTIDENEMVLLYFGTNSCGVCVDVKSKVGDMLKKYPRIKAYQVDIDDSIKIATNYSIFTIPAILLFIRGKETIREARHISILDLDKKIARYYTLLFD